MSVSDYTIKHIILSSWVEPASCAPQPQKSPCWTISALLNYLRHWLDSINIGDRQFAHRLCRLIPSQCPFARTIKLFGWTLLEIPPLCKINPLYDELMALRWRALCYLADECGEDISQYC